MLVTPNKDQSIHLCLNYVQKTIPGSSYKTRDKVWPMLTFTLSQIAILTNVSCQTPSTFAKGVDCSEATCDRATRWLVRVTQQGPCIGDTYASLSGWLTAEILMKIHLDLNI